MSSATRTLRFLVLQLNPQRLLRDALRAGALNPIVHADLVRRVGERDADWIVSSCSEHGIVADWTIHDMTRGAPAPPLERFDAVFTTGSRLGPNQGHACLRTARLTIERIASSDQPFFGICLGHQLLAQVAGVEVGPNACGPELGVVRLTITEIGQQSPVLMDMDASFDVTVSHGFEVMSVPSGARLILAGTESPIQGLQYGTRVFSVQAHPEAETTIGAVIFDLRGRWLVREGRWTHDQFRAAVRNLVTAIRTRSDERQGLLLANFVREIVVPYATSR